MFEFALVRDEDESGVSGTGEVAQGFVFDDGTVAMRWRTEHRSTALYASLYDVIRIHGHGGRTRIVPRGERAEVYLSDLDRYGCEVAMITYTAHDGWSIETVGGEGVYHHKLLGRCTVEHARWAAVQFLQVGALNVGTYSGHIWSSKHQGPLPADSDFAPDSSRV